MDTVFQVGRCPLVVESVRKTVMEIPGEMKVLMNHVYEFKKGVRSMVLCTLNRDYEDYAEKWMAKNRICYLKQDAGANTFNLYFGKPECMEVIGRIISKPLYKLSPEEDFILGTLLGYDLCQQCRRYCSRKMKHDHDLSVLEMH